MARSRSGPLGTIGKLCRGLGPLAAVLFIADSVLQRLSRARVLVTTVQEPALLATLDATLPPGFTAGVRSADALGTLCPACAAELTPEFLREASRKGDFAVVIMEHGSVVSYQWVSDELTLAYDDLWIGFGPRYLYGYNSFTAPTHRGRQLNRIGVVIAAQALAVPRGKGQAGYIMASNVASLLAHARVSKVNFGFALAWPHGSQGLKFYASPNGRRAGLRLERRACVPAAHIAREAEPAA